MQSLYVFALSIFSMLRDFDRIEDKHFWHDACHENMEDKRMILIYLKKTNFVY